MFLLAISTLLSACLDTGSNQADDADDTEPTDNGSIPDVQLSDSQVQPLARVPMTGLDEDTDLSELYVRYQVESGEIPGLDPSPDALRVLPLMKLDDSVFTLAPLLDTQGAVISLRVTDGESRGAPLRLSIGALPPPRDHAMADLKAAMERNLKAATEELGKDYPDTWEHWEGNMNQMPAWLFPMMRTWLSLQNWPAPGDHPEAEQLLARILAEKPLISQMHDQAAMMEAGETALSLAADQTPVMNNSMPVSSVPTGRAVGRATARNGSGLQMSGLVPINNAEQLAEMLDDYDDLKDLQRDLETFDETVGTYLSTVATLASLPAGPEGAALVSAGRAAAIEKLSNVAGNVAGTAGVTRWFLPSKISSMNTTLDPADGQIENEDHEENQIKITDVTATAKSDTVDIGEKIMSQVADQLTSAAGNAASGSMDILLDGGGVASEMADYGANQATQGYLDSLNISQELTFVWPDIDMMMNKPQEWLDHEATTYSGGGQTILNHDDSQQGAYEFSLRTPEAFIWPSSLLRLKTDRDKFPRTAVDSTLIDLEYIELDVNPPYVSIKADRSDPVDFSITVENSILDPGDDPYIDTPLTVTPQGLGSVELQNTNPDGTLNYHYLPPEKDIPDDTIIRISTHATSSKGIRGHEDAPPRTGTFRITTETDPKNLDVTPSQLCLESGENKTFKAVNTFTGQPIPAQEVDWSASGGTIDAAGKYTAPGSNGEETVTASTQNEEGKTLTDTASVTTGDCSCLWEATLDHPKFAEDSLAGKVASLSLVFNDTHYTGLHMTMEGTSGSTGGAMNPDQVTTLLFRLENPVAMDHEGAWTSPATLTSGSAVAGTPGGQGQGATNFLSGEPFALIFPDSGTGQAVELPPLRLEIDAMAPIQRADLPPQSATMKGRVEGLVGYPSDLELSGVTIPGAGPAEYATLEANFEGVFSFRPTSKQINCQTLN